MKTLTLEQMQLVGGACDNIWKRIGVMIPSSLSLTMIVGGFALGLASGGTVPIVTAVGAVAGAAGGYVICRLARS